AARWRENPFFILGIAPDTGELEAERVGRKLLGQLELGLSSVRIAETPLGPLERTPELVRQALADVHDLRRRDLLALLASLPAAQVEGAAPELQAPWAEAMQALGWKAFR